VPPLEEKMQIRTRRSVTGVLVGIAALVIVTAASAQNTDPVIGTWKLDVAKSTYKPGPAPKSSTVVVEAAGGKGIKVSVDAVNADGSPSKWGFTTQRDGKEVPVTGNPMFDTATSTQSSPTAGATEYKKGDKVVYTTKLALSKDGKTMTLTSTGTDAKGQAVHNVSVYTKQ
jgi:hypothetical protein